MMKYFLRFCFTNAQLCIYKIRSEKRKIESILKLSSKVLIKTSNYRLS